MSTAFKIWNGSCWMKWLFLLSSDCSFQSFCWAVFIFTKFLADITAAIRSHRWHGVPYGHVGNRLLIRLQTICRRGIWNWATQQTKAPAETRILNDHHHRYCTAMWLDTRLNSEQWLILFLQLVVRPLKALWRHHQANAQRTLSPIRFKKNFLTWSWNNWKYASNKKQYFHKNDWRESQNSSRFPDFLFLLLTHLT